MDTYHRVHEWDEAVMSAAMCSADTDVDKLIAQLNYDHAKRMSSLTTGKNVRLGVAATADALFGLNKVYQRTATPNTSASQNLSSRQHLLSPSLADEQPLDGPYETRVPAKDRDLSRVSRRLAAPSILDDLSLEELHEERRRQQELLAAEERRRDEAFKRLEAYRHLGLEEEFDDASTIDSLPAVSALSGQPSRRPSHFVGSNESVPLDRGGLVRSPAPEVPLLNIKAAQQQQQQMQQAASAIVHHARKGSDSPPDLAATWHPSTGQAAALSLDAQTRGTRLEGHQLSVPNGTSAADVSRVSSPPNRKPWRGGGIAPPPRTQSPPRPTPLVTDVSKRTASTVIRDPLVEQARLRREYHELTMQPMSPRDVAALISPYTDVLTRKESGIYNTNDEESILGLTARTGIYRDPLFVHAPFGYNQHTGQTARGELRGVGGASAGANPTDASGMVRHHSDGKMSTTSAAKNSKLSHHDKHESHDAKDKGHEPSAAGEKRNASPSSRRTKSPKVSAPKETNAAAVPSSNKVPSPPPPAPTAVAAPPPAPVMRSPSVTQATQTDEAPLPAALRPSSVTPESPHRGTGMDESGNAADFFDPTVSAEVALPHSSKPQPASLTVEPSHHTHRSTTDRSKRDDETTGRREAHRHHRHKTASKPVTPTASNPVTPTVTTAVDRPALPSRPPSRGPTPELPKQKQEKDASLSDSDSESYSYSYSYSSDASSTDDDDDSDSESDTQAPQRAPARSGPTAASARQPLVRAGTSNGIRSAPPRSASARVAFVPQPAHAVARSASAVNPLFRSGSVVLKGQYRTHDGSVVKIVDPQVEVTAGDAYTPSTPLSVTAATAPGNRRSLFQPTPTVAPSAGVRRAGTWAQSVEQRSPAVQPPAPLRSQTHRIVPGAATAALDGRARPVSATPVKIVVPASHAPTTFVIPAVPMHRAGNTPERVIVYPAHGPSPASEVQRSRSASQIVMKRPDGSFLVRPAPAHA